MTYVAEQMRDSGAQSSELNGGTEVTELWRVYNDTGAVIDTGADVRASGVLPEYGEYAAGTNATLVKIDLAPEGGNRSIWYATLNYVTRTSADSGGDDPLDQPAKISFSTLKTKKAADYQYKEGDTMGNPTDEILNIVGDPFNPPLQEEYFNLIISVEKNYRDFDVEDLINYSDTMNDNAITIAGVTMAAKQGWMMPLKHRTMYKENGDSYDRVRFDIAVNRDNWGWDRNVLQIGYNANFITGEEPSQVITFREITYDDVNGGTYNANTSKRVTDPRKLSATGQLITDDTKFFDTYQTKFQTSWDPLSLPVRKDGRI